MTEIRNKVTRKTASVVYDGGQNRSIVVTIYPKTIGFRTSGTRQEYKLPISACLRMAIEADIDAGKRRNRTAKRVSAL